jgi:hypothetical protein
MMETEELRGSFACPICGRDTPHHHSDEQVVAYQENELHRGDGWISVTLRQPTKRGWYLCSDIVVDPNQYGKKKDFWDHHPLWSQLSWFLWVRDGGRSGNMDNEIQEVLFYDPLDGGWRLRNLLGNAAVSGAESRRTVHATPKYWRELPANRQSTGGSDGR